MRPDQRGVVRVEDGSVGLYISHASTGHAHRQTPVDRREQLALEQIHLDEAHAPDPGVARVGAERVGQGLGPAGDGRDDEAMDRQARDGEVGSRLAHAIDVLRDVSAAASRRRTKSRISSDECSTLV